MLDMAGSEREIHSLHLRKASTQTLHFQQETRTTPNLYFLWLKTYWFQYSLVHCIVRTDIILIALPVWFRNEYLEREYVS